MRIGLFSDTYLPDINGVVTSIETLRIGLIKEGHEVFVIANHSSLLSLKYEDNKLLLPGIELKFLFDYNFSGPMNFRAFEIIKTMNLDVIHVHTEFGIGIFARICARQLDVPLVYTYHTTYEDYTHYVNFLNSKTVDKFAKSAVAKLSKVLANPATILVTPSSKTKTMLQRYGIERPMHVIPTGIDLERFDDSDELMHQRSLVRHQFGISADAKVFIFVGRIAEEKNIQLLLDGFEKLLFTNADLYLLIVGSGPDLEKTSNWVKQRGLDKNIILVGRVENSQIAGYYHAADAFISASMTETQGLTFIEAMACGLPVFASDMNVLSDLLFENETGFFFDSVASFVSKAHHYLQLNTQQLLTIKARCHEVVRPYDSRIFAKSIVNVYQLAIDSYRGEYSVENIIRLTDHDYQVDLMSTAGQSKQVIVNQEKIDRYQLKEDRILNQQELQTLIKDDSFTQKYSLMLDRLTYRDYSNYQVTEFLNTSYPNEEESNRKILEILNDKGLVDDCRLIVEIINRQRAKGYGYYRVENSLAAYHFDGDLLSKNLNQLEMVQPEDCQKAIDSNRSLVRHGSPMQGLQRLTNKLLRDGFDSALVNRLIAENAFDFDEDSIVDECTKEYNRLYKRYLKQVSPKEANHKTISNLLNKGFKYETIILVSEQRNEENEEN